MISLQERFEIARFTLDYACVAASSDNVHRVGLTVDFDPRLPPGVNVINC
jgi:hypothetical protein